jgi:hypothetical protein
MKSERYLITTLTGEAQQPVRIYYQVFNQKTVIGAFQKLKCVYFESQLNRWRWEYEHEAKKLRFEISYNQLSKEHRPIVIGDFLFRDNEMLLDVRSFERAVKAIEFFDKRINRRAAKVTKIRIVNRLFDGNDPSNKELLQPPYDYFFDRDDIEIPDPNKTDKLMDEISSQHSDLEGRLAALQACWSEKAKQPLPEIEEIPLYIYEEGLGRLKAALTFRNIEALQHWQGNKNANQFDLMESVIDSFLKDNYEI